MYKLIEVYLGLFTIREERPMKKRSLGISSITADRHNRGLEITEVFIDENIVESFKRNTRKFNKAVKDYKKYLKRLSTDIDEIN